MEASEILQCFLRNLWGWASLKTFGDLIFIGAQIDPANGKKKKKQK